MRGQHLPDIDLKALPPALKEDGACFVTLTTQGQLRGCIGTLEARQPLAEDVREHAVAAGQDDYRFPPVSARELPDIQIEISRLSNPQAPGLFLCRKISSKNYVREWTGWCSKTVFAAQLFCLRCGNSCPTPNVSSITYA